jgi:hypothetical protein
MQLFSRLFQAVFVAAVDDEDHSVRVGEVVAPERSILRAPSNVQHF